MSATCGFAALPGQEHCETASGGRIVSPMNLLDTQLYSIIGEQGFTRLVAAFYRRIPTDDILGPLYSKKDLSGAEARLRLFLIQRFGGPDHYSQQRGHPRLRMRHAPFPVNSSARSRWLSIMGEALAETNLPADATAMLRRFFEDSATFLINHPD
jgi:hemoglobin